MRYRQKTDRQTTYRTQGSI